MSQRDHNPDEGGQHAASKTDEYTRVMHRAVDHVQEQNRQRGIPNVYSINGIIYYELPDGSLSREDPWQGRSTPPESGRDGNDSNADAQPS